MGMRVVRYTSAKPYTNSTHLNKPTQQFHTLILPTAIRYIQVENAQGAFGAIQTARPARRIIKGKKELRVQLRVSRGR
ncbi:hypothetical protein BDM02DRAFT_3119536 [Thelephora ganbajun]|uniref:Uncharacterized protein n=1 Tax=Thelephora ganbajun TaxID=370292 RepID=A0ACB6Z8L5_THEGA|nr:hypothetical protein BDM02DRAFT_3119536 [Thelephora ganbajun]